MRFSRSRPRLWLLSSTAFAAALALFEADLYSVADNTVAGSAVERALYRLMRLPGGTVLGRRPPTESTKELTALLNHSPERSDLYALRAAENERELSINGAENDWQRAAELAVDKAAAFLDLADFYHRRLQPAKELQALLRAAKLPGDGLDRFRPVHAQPGWRAFERAVDVAKQARLGTDATDDLYQSWIERYPDSSEPYTAYLNVLAAARNLSRAQALAARITAQFPANIELQTETEAKIAAIEGGSATELAVYSRRFSPLWPGALRARYFELLTGAHEQRRFLGDARAAAAAHPNDLDPVLRLFFYYEQSGDQENADRELLEWQTRRSASRLPLTANELKTAAALFERAGDYHESAHASYSLYELDAASSAEKEGALSELISLLLDVPEQPLGFGRRDLSLYRNIAQMDRHPGFLNGILSLALNTTFPQYEYQNASQTAAMYFHRASASKLIEKMKQQFPKSSRLPALEAKLFSAYAVYGQDEALMRLVPAWLTANSNTPEYADNALLLGDAYFRAKRSADEFRLYDHLLQMLAARTDHVPIGPEPGQDVRSPDYVRVLERYLSRLTEAHRLTDAIALYKREIVRNPGDPGLYERLALFIEQNRLDDQLAETYRAAFAHFKDASWADKLARLYLRRKQYTNYEMLLRQVTDAFAGTELARFVNEVSPNAKITPVLYRQINLYAHRRFPHNLTFVRNLLRAYQAKATADPAAYEQLLRENWFYDATLRSAFFEYLTRTGKLQAKLAALPATDAAAQQGNLAAIQMRAEGSAWLARFEASAPAFARLAELVPGDRKSNARVIAIQRSLGASEPAAFTRAVQFAEQDVKAAPNDSSAIARVGEIYADREQYVPASPWWNRVAAIHPGLPAGYLDAATIFWDYFRYDDALRLITDARNAFRQPSLFAYEAGAIHENRGNFARAIDEYIRAALEQPATGQNALAQDRLLTLAGRQTTAKLVEERSAALMNGAFDARKLQLRIAILEKENRTSELHTLLDAALARAPTVSDADQIRQSAAHFGFDRTAAAALARMVALTHDPVEKIKTRIDLAIFNENHNNVSGGEHELDALLTENPALLGVIRANVDFYNRQKQYGKAVSTLMRAADRAVEPYRNELWSEAAQKAVDGGDYQTARALLDKLLAPDPFNADLLARKADTYARANDNAALTAFYDAELKALQNSPLTSAEKTNRVAGLRRGYILSLITAQKFSDALEQYEQVLNSFPEDDALAREAARFADQHSLADRLIGYYTKATAESPKNYRWPLLLARIDRVLGKYSDAVAAYDKAAYVRPDRADIFTAKADLELRLERFDAALKTNEKLYDLSYHDTRYLLEQAGIYARLGNRGECIRLLRSAYIAREPKNIAGYLAVARQLLAWRMFSEADAMYREMRPLLTSNPELARDAVAMELETLVSLHRFNDALAAAGWAARNIKDFAANGETARYCRAIGGAVRKYFTPEEKSQVAAQISRPGALPAPLRVYDLANAAGLFDIAANALASSPNGWTRLRELQNSRLAFASLGRAAENFAHQSRQDERRLEFLNAALDSDTKAGDSSAVLRVASALMKSDAIDTRRFAELFIKSHGDVSSLAAHAKYANAVVQYVIDTGTFSAANATVRVRGRSLPAPWTNSYTALAGVYFAQSGSPVTDAFDQILGPRTVDGELASLQNTTAAVLRNGAWLYYAARYGEYLSRNGQQSGAELLPASLESAPAASNSYVDLGDSLREMKQLSQATAEYQLALELSPQRSDVYDRLAQIALQNGQWDSARKNWRAALAVLTHQAATGPLSPQFSTDARTVLLHLSRVGIASDLQADIDAMLRAFVKRNGSYGVMPLFEGMLAEASDKGKALERLLQLAREIDIAAGLNEMLSAAWLPDAQKDTVYRFLIERANERSDRSAGDAAQAALEQLVEARANYAAFLLAQNRFQDAWNALQQIEPDRRPAGLVLKAAALSGHLDAQLKSYEQQQPAAPPESEVLQIASELNRDNHTDAALRIREFVYNRDLEHGAAPASAYFGLAEVRLKQGRASEANSLIENALMNTGAPFENLPEAVRLLEQAGRAQDAAKYATEWETAKPWNTEAKLAVARLSGNLAVLDQLRSSNANAYALRVQAASTLRKLGHVIDGPDELALLTHKTISAAEAERPFYTAARTYAAGSTAETSEKIKLLSEAIRLDPAIQEERLALAKGALELGRFSFASATLDSYRRQSGEVGDPQLNEIEEMAARAAIERNDFTSAIALCDRILVIPASAAVRDRVENLRRGAQHKERLALLNAARQPVISDELKQPVIVRPKLPALPDGGLE